MVKTSLSVAVIGAGLIGTSWAALFAAVGGHAVRVFDPSPAARAEVAARAAVMTGQLAALHEVTGSAPVVCDSLAEACSGAVLIQENAPERLDLKRALYAEIEAAAAADAIIASSTSALVWSDLARDLAQPRRFVTAHPFNPPHLMPLVELFGTDPAVLERAKEFYAALGRVPVVLKREAAGHIAGRLSAALWREAVALVADGVATVADIDRALVNGPGLRWAVVGPHMGYHLGGGDGGMASYLETLGPSQERRWASLGTPALTPEVRATLVAGIAEEAAGRSVGELAAARDRATIAILKSL
ncbi:3-hydroxyacyl-CoA dehydrogenase NAD-binding domain-containing protein [Phreatobacter sp. AB_2022a]|uniref:3-hydroxyacyl-CoA dehydrogenase NAD-binding domain-containing protein n=1 Tax=Phreatobacter sp. AB_2022a TaxID=3003134 RepID=UPI0022874717|nr:3-hydroxyacyl-CoA dehydrogenase NAD-binding domain-containing protein [Phreatobacter sp. AB_2022a]MCZ0735386.1 3-hydroxyacyl-CoA dehydrogenase NAD-binding domain-containing protein [Phreatobacter sp. AB_2022a]